MYKVGIRAGLLGKHGDEGNEQTKLVYCTSEIMVSEMTRAKRAGANGFLMKPFNREILIHKIQEVGIEIADKDSQAA